MSDLRDNIPPVPLASDELGSCFGMREMEMAAKEIIRLAVAAGHWKVSLDRTMFLNIDPSDYTVDGFDELIDHEWLERTRGDHWIVCEEFVKRLMKRLPSCFEVPA